jgi:5-methylthioadenosine/S-adenosylhomocysteine deaminase
MIRCGITTVVDLNKDYVATLKAMTDTGIRGVVGVGYDNSNNLDEIIERLKDTNKVVYAHNMYESSEEDFANYLQACKKYNVPFVTNASETLFEVGECDNEYGMTPIELLENYGMFDIPCVVAGASQVDKEEMQILSNYGVNIVTVPSKDLITGHGVAPIVAYNKNNINVCLGVDAISKNSDIFREMNLLISLQKGIMHKIDAIDNMYSISASTINSAKSYNLNKIGVLQKGNFADIILIQIGDICKISDIIYYTNPSHVLLTMIDGKYCIRICNHYNWRVYYGNSSISIFRNVLIVLLCYSIRNTQFNT